MFKITPPIRENVVKCGSLLLLAFICFCAYFHGYHQSQITNQESSSPERVNHQSPSLEGRDGVGLSRSLFYNPDSIAYYTALAAREDDPRALFIAGMATHLSYADPDYPFSPSTEGRDGVGLPSLSEADHYLLRAAELGYPDAITYIRCLAAHDQWPHFVPDNCK